MKCPCCDKWTLEYDEYFGRFRCFNPECNWLPASTTDVEIHGMYGHSEPRVLAKTYVEELNSDVTCIFHADADALVFDFGLNEPTFDLPDPDGRMIWRVANRLGVVAGFVICGVRHLGITEVIVDFETQRRCIEETVRRYPLELWSSRPSRVLVDNVRVTARWRKPSAPSVKREGINRAILEGIERFESEIRANP